MMMVGVKCVVMFLYSRNVTFVFVFVRIPKMSPLKRSARKISLSFDKIPKMSLMFNPHNVTLFYLKPPNCHILFVEFRIP